MEDATHSTPTESLPSVPLLTVPSSPPDSPFVTPLSSPTHTSFSSLINASPSSPTHTPASSPTPPSHNADKNPPAAPDLFTLTPLRAHYLKKQLIHLQFQRELDALVAAPTNNVSTFSYLGPPFSPPPRDAPQLELPLLRYWFRHFVITFPFLAAAPRDFFPETLQPFMVSILSRNLSPTSVLDDAPEDAEDATRTRILAKFERNMAMLTTSGTKLVEPEEVVRLTQADLTRLEKLAEKRAARERKLKDLFDVNVVCVRTVTEKRRIRNRVHEEFIVRTRRARHPDVFVSRRYGDFRTLADELRKAHPSETIPPPPAKDRTFVNVTVTSPSASPPLSAGYSTSGYSSGPPSMMTSPATSTIRAPLVQGMPGVYDLPSSSSSSSSDSFSMQPPLSPTSFSMQPPTSSTSTSGGMNQQASRLAREKNRLTLRSYLHTLLASSEIASSPVLRSFLLSSPTKLSPEEVEDARRREEADSVREDGRKRFAQEITSRVDGLRDAVRGVKGELLAKDGLTRIFATIKQTEDVHKLPENYQAVVEWARITLASTVFHHFVAADNASQSFAGLKRIHGMIPYFMLKAALKISNPMGMIRGVLDLFLAQPFGGRSLLQRMFTGSLMEEVRALEEDINAVKVKVSDDPMCEKVRLFVYAPREIQAVYKADAAAENVHIIAAVLRSREDPALTRQQMQRVMYAHRAHKEYVKYTETLTDSDDDEGPQDEAAWLFEDLSVLAKLYSRLRDREQLIELIFEGTTAELLKDIITIFYAPLAQVYRAASIADSLGDVQNFINDLIRTVEQCEDSSQLDPAQTVQVFINLIQRHEQSFYNFVHKVHSKGEGLFSALMQWIELFLTLMRDGLGEPLSLEFLLPHTGQERADIIKEVDEIALYHYKLKVVYEDKDEMAAQLVNGVVRDLSFGELVDGDVDDLAAEDTDEDDDSSSYESSSGTGSSGDDDDEDEDDGEDDEDESESDGSTEGNATESPAQPVRQGPPVARSHTITIGHLPQLSRPTPYPNRKASMDVLSGSNRPTPRPPQRSRTISAPGTPLIRSPPAMYKDVPPTPSRVRTPTSAPLPRRSPPAGERRREKSKPPQPPKKRKGWDIKPPELQHIPTLLPIFREMLRPLLQTHNGGAPRPSS
ncbi:hypothetical protein SCP_0207530 [Sparassis crispa]|uniref:PX domain-containing protein n=1 Tax=Sparassis crispa TaxID=139825 RepID=A0A401GBP7_9APHY|nr:hypothetical protein SCP_0207530 [Sparassis crispa]GBE79553.1 hypothetical protein SCP_0207530 [Sparassis crispa]